ncbi:MAG: hypothetical protein KDA79_18240 [Planctomycetaceae bacterium]|nr:hypothetical protein [Planctomycetaceae bacterium]
MDPAVPPAQLPGASRKRQKTVRIGLMLVIFTGGIIVGSGVTATWLHNQASHVFKFDPAEARQRMIERLDNQFNLSEEQEQQASAIIDGHFERFRSFRDRMKPLISAEMDRFQEEIGGILDEEQQKSWQDDSESFRKLLWPRGDRKHRHHRGGHEGRKGGPGRHRDEDSRSEARENRAPPSEKPVEPQGTPATDSRPDSQAE